MDWQNEGDLIAFLQAVKEHRAHLPDRGWSEGKWERVRNDLASAFPQRTMNSVSALNSHFHHMLPDKSGQFPRALTVTTMVEHALHELVQERNLCIANAQMALQQREAIITNTMVKVQSSCGNSGSSGSLFTCSNDSINVAALQVLQIARVHQLEVGITLNAKWKMAYRMLNRILPSVIVLPHEKSIRERAFPSYMKDVAAKYGTSGPPANYAGLLDSEKVACQMLAEGTVSSIPHQEAAKVETDDAISKTVNGDGNNASARKRKCGNQHAAAKCKSSRGQQEATDAGRKVKASKHHAQQTTHPPADRMPVVSAGRSASASVPAAVTATSSGHDSMLQAQHSSAAAFSPSILQQDLVGSCSTMSSTSCKEENSPNHCHQKSSHTKKKARRGDEQLDAQVALKKLEILGDATKLQLQNEGKMLEMENRKLDVEGKRLDIEGKRLEMETKRLDVEGKRLELEMETRRLDAELERIKLQQVHGASK